MSFNYLMDNNSFYKFSQSIFGKIEVLLNFLNFSNISNALWRSKMPKTVASTVEQRPR